MLNTQDWELARDVVNTLSTFMASADLALDGRHFARFLAFAQATRFRTNTFTR